MKTKYIAYYRVSTKKQSYGLTAQKDIVNNFIQNRNGILLAEYSEQESGKKANRVELQKAVSVAKENKAVLIVAKLDRLSREVSFIFDLKKELDQSEVKLYCVDLPELNTLNLGIFATMAQHERETISKRTKAGLKVARSKGKQIGSPGNLTSEAKNKGLQIRQANSRNNENNVKGYELIRMYLKDSLTWAQITAKLNEKGFKAARGGKLSVVQVQRMYNKFNTDK